MAIMVMVIVITGEIADAITRGAAQPDGNPHRRSFGKEPGQTAYDVLFESMSHRLIGHGETSVALAGSRRILSLPGGGRVFRKTHPAIAI